MKVLFLDIDGVVNCAKTTQRSRGYIGIDPVLADKVRRIIKLTRCNVVLSSAWRLDEQSRNEVRKKVCDFMAVTPNIGSGFRGFEVLTWMQSRPDVKTYAILDDNTDFYAEQPLFKTEWETGITDDVAMEVVNYLNKGSDS
jgi:hypothetical protein